jgi:ABC-type transport system involved in Fe-S cluster assembly fused permease/ATPase subunit
MGIVTKSVLTVLVHIATVIVLLLIVVDSDVFPVAKVCVAVPVTCPVKVTSWSSKVLTSSTSKAVGEAEPPDILPNIVSSGIFFYLR